MLSALASLLPRSRATSPATRPAPSAPWMREALEDLERTVSAPGFPCLFGRKALASKRCVVAYASREAPAVEAFEAICKYLDEVRELPARDRILRPLILFFESASSPGSSTSRPMPGRSCSSCTSRTHSPGRSTWRAIRATRPGRSAWPGHRCSST